MMLCPDANMVPFIDCFVFQLVMVITISLLLRARSITPGADALGPFGAEPLVTTRSAIAPAGIKGFALRCQAFPEILSCELAEAPADIVSSFAVRSCSSRRLGGRPGMTCSHKRRWCARSHSEHLSLKERRSRQPVLRLSDLSQAISLGFRSEALLVHRGVQIGCIGYCGSTRTRASPRRGTVSLPQSCRSRIQGRG